MAYIAALTQRTEFATGILILLQQQSVLAPNKPRNFNYFPRDEFDCESERIGTTPNTRVSENTSLTGTATPGLFKQFFEDSSCSLTRWSSPLETQRNPFSRPIREP